MFIRKILFIALSAGILLSPLFAQNYLLDDGQSSFHLRGKYTRYFAGLDIVELEPGYTFNGRTTLSANYRQLLYGQDIFERLVMFTGVGINYQIVKEKVFPISVSAGASYEFGLIEYTDVPGVTEPEFAKHHELNLYTNYSKRIFLSPAVQIVPSVSAGIISRNIIYPVGWSHHSQAPATNNFIYSLQTDILFRSFCVFVKSNYFSDGFDNAFSLSFNTFDVGIGILLNRKTK